MIHIAQHGPSRKQDCNYLAVESERQPRDRAARLIAGKFGLSIDTAATVAALAGIGCEAAP
jgi:hypothetical protein